MLVLSLLIPAIEVEWTSLSVYLIHVVSATQNIIYCSEREFSRLEIAFQNTVSQITGIWGKVRRTKSRREASGRATTS